MKVGQLGQGQGKSLGTSESVLPVFRDQNYEIQPFLTQSQEAIPQPQTQGYRLRSSSFRPRDPGPVLLPQTQGSRLQPSSLRPRDPGPVLLLQTQGSRSQSPPSNPGVLAHLLGPSSSGAETPLSLHSPLQS
jgi:hypothetical protein